MTYPLAVLARWLNQTFENFESDNVTEGAYEERGKEAARQHYESCLATLNRCNYWLDELQDPCLTQEPSLRNYFKEHINGLCNLATYHLAKPRNRQF